jgi:hypothetical protein
MAGSGGEGSPTEGELPWSEDTRQEDAVDGAARPSRWLEERSSTHVGIASEVDAHPEFCDHPRAQRYMAAGRLDRSQKEEWPCLIR